MMKMMMMIIMIIIITIITINDDNHQQKRRNLSSRTVEQNVARLLRSLISYYWPVTTRKRGSLVLPRLDKV